MSDEAFVEPDVTRCGLAKGPNRLLHDLGAHRNEGSGILFVSDRKDRALLRGGCRVRRDGRVPIRIGVSVSLPEKFSRGHS